MRYKTILVGLGMIGMLSGCATTKQNKNHSQNKTLEQLTLEQKVQLSCSLVNQRLNEDINSQGVEKYTSRSPVEGVFDAACFYDEDGPFNFFIMEDKNPDYIMTFDIDLDGTIDYVQRLKTNEYEIIIEEEIIFPNNMTPKELKDSYASFEKLLDRYIVAVSDEY